MRTKHMEDRMRQRGISDEMVGAIWELGEWNSRGDRLELPEKAIRPFLQEKRNEVKMLERLARRGGALLVLDGDTMITVYPNTRRMRS